MKKLKFVLLILLLLLSFITVSFAVNDVTVIVNDEKIIFTDQKPVIISRRILVPARAVFEKMGAVVNWSPAEKKITIDNVDFFITIFIDDFNIGIVEKVFNNNKTATLDVAPQIIAGRAMIPLNAVSVALNVDEVTWEPISRTANIKMLSKNEINPKLYSFAIDNVELNFYESKDVLINKLGPPSRIDQSQYGFKWYIYNDNYEKYIQVGVLNDKIVAFFSNSPKFNYRGIKSGSSKGNAVKILGGDVSEKKILFSDSLTKTVVYSDNINNLTVDAVLIVLKESHKGSVIINQDVIDAFEKQIFDITNVMRIKNGMNSFEWDEKAAASARKHSKDMSVKNYFSHESLDGRSPFDRMISEGISYHYAAENICSGQLDGFDAHNDWINSEGHRHNIFNDKLERLGIGIAMKDNVIYYTQNFYTPY